MEPMTTSQDRVYSEIYQPFSDKYLHEFKDFLLKDYKNKRFNFAQRILDTICIDMDQIEIDLRNDQDRTMDLVIGISKYDNTTQSIHDKRLLPVELKLGCLSIDAISKTELMGKDQHTRNLLSGHPVDSFSIFIFTNKVAPQAKSEKARWEKEANASAIKNWLMMSPTDYNAYIGFREDFPYQPITNLTAISQMIHQLSQEKNYDGCIDYIEEKKYEAEIYKLKYNINECKAITSSLYEAITAILVQEIPTDYSDYLYLLLGDVKTLGDL